MKKTFKFLLYFLITVLTIAFIVGISAFSNFYNNLSILGISSIVLSNISIITIITVIVFLLTLLSFIVRTNISFSRYQLKTDLKQGHKKFFIVLDIIVSLLLTAMLILNYKNIYAYISLVKSPSSILDFYNYPFILQILKTIITYLCIFIIYLILPILYFSHKSYNIRFLFSGIVPHKFSPLISLYLLVSLVFVSLSISVLTLIFSVEIYPNYSLVLTTGFVVSLVVFLYSLLLFTNLLRGVSIPWYLNAIPLFFVILFVAVSTFSKSIPSVNLLKLELIDTIHKEQLSSKFLVKVKEFSVEELFEKMDLRKLEYLNTIQITDYSLPRNEDAFVKVVRNSKILERVYLFLSSGVLDYLVKPNFTITNYLNLSDVFEILIPYSFSLYSKLGNTNFLEVSIPYEFNEQVFFYKLHLLSWYNDDTKVQNITLLGSKSDLQLFTSKDYYIITKKLKPRKDNEIMFYTKGTNYYYYILSGAGFCIILSNENYFKYDLKDYSNGENFIFVEGVPLLISNISLGSKVVGMKVRYFDIEGRGNNIQSSISNLIGNANYYYKVVELTNRIGALKRYLKENEDKIPPDVLDKIRSFIPE